MKINLALLLCMFGLTQCHNKVYTLDNLPKQFIEMGSYGGFAGTATSYYFMPNGQRFISKGLIGADSTNGISELIKAKPKDYKNLLKQLKDLDFNKLNMNDVGNMTYFIKLKTNKIEKKIQWVNMDTAPTALVDFYRNTLKNSTTKTPQLN